MQTQSNDTLVSSSDVSGTDVYGTDRNKVGHIDRVMIDKVSGKVAYAVMNFGGVLGIGGNERPVPWDKLNYDTSLDGFQTDITPEQLEQAPDATADWSRDRTWEERTYAHYGSRPYWQ